MTQRTILDVDWIVLEETMPPAAEPVIVSAQPAPPEPQKSSSGQSPTVPPAGAIFLRPWAKPLLTCALALAVLWLAVVMICIIDGVMFADGIVRLSLILAGVPILYLLAVAIFADPNRNIKDDIYRTFNPVGCCTPSRSTFTGNDVHRR